MEKFKVKVGDYVDTSNMNEPERIHVVTELLREGCQKGEWYEHAAIDWKLIGNNPSGVFYGDSLECFAEDCGGKTRRITIEQLLSDDSIEAGRPGAWSGEGIPPVGTVCEATWGAKVEWLRCVILWGNVAAIEHGEDFYTENIDDYDGSCAFEFRPLQSEEQKQVAEIAEIIGCCGRLVTTVAAEVFAKAIYNAGFRKVVE